MIRRFIHGIHQYNLVHRRSEMPLIFEIWFSQVNLYRIVLSIRSLICQWMTMFLSRFWVIALSIKSSWFLVGNLFIALCTVLLTSPKKDEVAVCGCICWLNPNSFILAHWQILNFQSNTLAIHLLLSREVKVTRLETWIFPVNLNRFSYKWYLN